MTTKKCKVCNRYKLKKPYNNLDLKKMKDPNSRVCVCKILKKIKVSLPQKADKEKIAKQKFNELIESIKIQSI